jgi:hypothetical protein
VFDPSIADGSDTGLLGSDDLNVPMTLRPNSAFACSVIGGAITLISSIVSINSWFFMYSGSGTTFNYTLWYFFGSVDFTAAEALVLFVIGVICGVLIIFGAVLQYSGQESNVRNGSILVLLATIVGVPSTYFGMLIGGILSITGAYAGLTWKPGPKT